MHFVESTIKIKLGFLQSDDRFYIPTLVFSVCTMKLFMYLEGVRKGAPSWIGQVVV